MVGAILLSSILAAIAIGIFVITVAMAFDREFIGHKLKYSLIVMIIGSSISTFFCWATYMAFTESMAELDFKQTCADRGGTFIDYETCYDHPVEMEIEDVQ